MTSSELQKEAERILRALDNQAITQQDRTDEREFVCKILRAVYREGFAEGIEKAADMAERHHGSYATPEYIRTLKLTNEVSK